MPVYKEMLKLNIIHDNEVHGFGLIFVPLRLKKC